MNGQSRAQTGITNVVLIASTLALACAITLQPFCCAQQNEQDQPAPPAALDQMIPEFGKADPAVPATMAQAPVASPGFGQGYVPSAAPPPAVSPEEARVAQLEKSVFGSSYPEHEVDDRLEHLEREVFGKAQAGGTMEFRLSRLEGKMGITGGAFGHGGAPSTPVARPSPSYQAPPQQAYQPPATAPTYPPAQPNYATQQPQQAYTPQQPYAAAQPNLVPSQPAYSPPAQAYPPNAQAYAPPGTQQYAPAQRAYPPQGYSSPQLPYPPTQTGYTPASPGYAAPQQGYPAPQQAYPAAQQGYPAAQQGYPAPQQGYPAPQQGYPAPQQGYPAAQQGYPAAQQGYPAPQQGYPAPQQGYPTQQGYPPPQQGYPAAQQGYPAPQQGYAPSRQNGQPQQRYQTPVAAAATPLLATPGQYAAPTTAKAGDHKKSASAQPTKTAKKTPTASGSPKVTNVPPLDQAPEMVPPSNANDKDFSEFQTVVQSIPFDPQAGDYFNQIQRLSSASYAHWTSFPIRVHLPMGTAENWKSAIETGIRKWGQVVPLLVAPAQEPADVEVAWINHLQPKQLGITNLEIFNGRMRVTVYLLRPSYYPPDVSEKMLQQVATHQMGHALGIFGHSAAAGDVMLPIDPTSKTAHARTSNISQRDINTLRRVYQSQSLPSGYQSAQPISWP